MSTTEGSATGGNPFLGGKKLKGAPTNATAKPEKRDPFAGIRDNLKKNTTTTPKEDKTTEEDPIAKTKRGLKPKPAMHPGMLNENDKKDLEILTYML